MELGFLELTILFLTIDCFLYIFIVGFVGPVSNGFQREFQRVPQTHNKLQSLGDITLMIVINFWGFFFFFLGLIF